MPEAQRAFGRGNMLPCPPSADGDPPTGIGGPLQVGGGMFGPGQLMVWQLAVLLLVGGTVPTFGAEPTFPDIQRILDRGTLRVAILASPHFSPRAVARGGRCPWLQGARQAGRGGVADTTSSTRPQRNAVDAGRSRAAAGEW